MAFEGSPLAVVNAVHDQACRCTAVFPGGGCVPRGRIASHVALPVTVTVTVTVWQRMEPCLPSKECFHL